MIKRIFSAAKRGKVVNAIALSAALGAVSIVNFVLHSSVSILATGANPWGW